MRMRTFILAVTGIALCVAACSSYGTSAVYTEPPARVASVSVTVPTSLKAGQTARGVAVPKDASGVPLTDRRVAWYSSSTSIASVTDSGVISAVAPGNAVVSAVSEGVSGQATLAIVPPAPTPIATLSVDISPSSVLIGQAAYASATLLDSTGTPLVGRSVAWQSSNSAVAAVAQTGDITAIAAGTAMISATSEGKSAASAITVVAPAPVPVASVSVSPATASLQVGGTLQLSAVTRDANNNVLTGRTVSWSSNNTGIATVSASGFVTAVAAGSVTATALSEGQSGNATITVTVPPPPAPVASVSVSPATSSIQVGGSVQLSAVTRDANNNVLSGRVVAWSSGDPSIAAVNSTSGLVTGVSAGSATITAISETKTGTAPITVTASVGPVWRGNEPPGMVQLANRPFSALSEEGWGISAASGSTANFSIATDSTAPRSPANVGRIRFPQGFVAGGEPVVVYKNLTPGRKRYWSYWFKVSDVWQGQSTGGCKVHHLYVNGLNRLIVYIAGAGLTSPITPTMAYQQLAGNYNATAQGGNGTTGDGWLLPNQPGQTGVRIVRGQWVLVEGFADAGTPGGSNGSVKWWINGALVGSYTGIPFVAAGGNATWQDWSWGPTWGGLGGTVGQDQYQYIDDLYISGGN